MAEDGGTRILHVVPDSAARPRHRHLGSTKDVRGRSEYLAARGLACDEIAPRLRSDEALIEYLQGTDLLKYTDVLIETPVYYPRSLAFLRRIPGLRIVGRPINAEFFHQLHRLWGYLRVAEARQGRIDLRLAVWQLRHAIYRLRLDWSLGRGADHVLSISDWETRHYWRWLCPAGRAVTVPYFLPAEYREAPVRAAKLDQCVCLMSTSEEASPFLVDALNKFSRLVTGLGGALPDWSFCVTGDAAGHGAAGEALPGRIRTSGFLESPAALLAQSRAVAILSDYGFGFKTKILDAISYSCYVLVPRGLFGRLPLEVRPYCLVVDARSPASLAAALDASRRPFPSGDPNGLLRRRAFAELDNIFLRTRVGRETDGAHIPTAGSTPGAVG